MVGVSDGTQVWTDVVPVEFFRHDTDIGFKTKQYLNQYAFLAGSLLAAFEATPQTHRIEICSGFINTRLKDNLRKEGYDVRVTEITGLLQDKLEEYFRRYVRDTIGRDIYYDPKAIGVGEVAVAYKEIVDWAWKHCPHLLKTGWSSFNKE